jgi:uncharacterized protein YozE (UPF0346 family)
MKRSLTEQDVCMFGVRGTSGKAADAEEPVREEVVANLVTWIGAHCERRKGLDKNFGSYSWKHRAERRGHEDVTVRVRGLARKVRVPGLGEYVANGEFIAAAIRAGYRAEQKAPGSPNAWFDMAIKTPTVRLSGFTTWLLRQTKREDPVGDFARDVARDTGWPVDAQDHDDARAYLERQFACSDAIHAFEQAWEAWTAGTNDDSVVAP